MKNIPNKTIPNAIHYSTVAVDVFSSLLNKCRKADQKVYNIWKNYLLFMQHRISPE